MNADENSCDTGVLCAVSGVTVSLMKDSLKIFLLILLQNGEIGLE